MVSSAFLLSWFICFCSLPFSVLSCQKTKKLGLRWCYDGLSSVIDDGLLTIKLGGRGGMDKHLITFHISCINWVEWLFLLWSKHFILFFYIVDENKRGVLFISGWARIYIIGFLVLTRGQFDWQWDRPERKTQNNINKSIQVSWFKSPLRTEKKNPYG